jgi:predicted Rdx family selenoprotein
LAAALVEAFRGPVGAKSALREIVLIPSGNGRYEIEVDGELVYSKAATGRHIDPEDVIRLIRDRTVEGIAPS